MTQVVYPDGHRIAVDRAWVGEAPVALEYNGVSYAVMMATPAELEDFVTGFALTEGLAATVAEISFISSTEVPLGWIARASLAGPGAQRIAERARMRVAESSCGLCGIENLEALATQLPKVAAHPAIEVTALFQALSGIGRWQVLGRKTGGAHAAAWCAIDGTIACLREDVGRHNAIDKLVGAMARAGQSLGEGFVLSTARCSFEIVEKAVRAGATTLVTVSVPTSLAVERARQAGLSLWSLAREDSVLLVNDASEPFRNQT